MKKSPNYRRNQSSISLFEKSQTLEALSKQGNPLESISGIVEKYTRGEQDNQKRRGK